MNMRFRAVLAGILLLSAAFPIGGCGFKDIDKRFFVVAMGIDPGSVEGTVKVTLRLAIPSSKFESGEARTELETLEAPTIAEAVRHIKSTVDKELDFGHCRAILFGKKMMEDGADEPINWLLRRRDIQMIAFVGMAEPNANAVLHLQPKSERYPGNALFLSFGNEGTESPYILTEFLFDWVRRLNETGKDGYLPIVRVDADNNSYRIDKVAFLDKKKLRLCLNPGETQLFKLTAKQFKKSIVSVPFENIKLVLSVSKVKTRMRITPGENPEVTYFVKISGMLEESPPKLMNGNMRAIEQHMEKEFNAQLEDLLYKIRDAGVDPYGFGLHYLAIYFGRSPQWKQWQADYPTIKLRVKSRFVIKETGLIE